MLDDYWNIGLLEYGGDFNVGNIWGKIYDDTF